MDIRDTLKNLERDRAIKIIADVLRHLSNNETKFAIAAVDARSKPPVEVQLIAQVEDEWSEELKLTLDEGCDYGQCTSCGVLLRSKYKNVVCPLCGRVAKLT